MLAALKGLPFAYSRDLAEEKHAAFDPGDVLMLVLPAMTERIRTMHVNVDIRERQATEGSTLATEVAGWLARRGVPFSEGHAITGALVRACEDRGVKLADLPNGQVRAADQRLDQTALRPLLSARAAVVARSGHGGTAPEHVQERLAALRARTGAQRAWTGECGGPRLPTR